MSEQTRTVSGRRHTTAIIVAAVLDAAFVLIFAALGRAEHGGGAVAASAVWHAAWPFLLALAVMWLVALVWKRPFAVLKSGLPVWLGTVALGMVLRVTLTDGGFAVPFLLVALGVLGLTLVGWRLIALPVRRRGERSDVMP